MFGYEEESDKYTIVLLEKDGLEYVIWQIGDKYEFAPRKEYFETEVFLKRHSLWKKS